MDFCLLVSLKIKTNRTKVCKGLLYTCPNLFSRFFTVLWLTEARDHCDVRAVRPQEETK